MKGEGKIEREKRKNEIVRKKKEQLEGKWPKWRKRTEEKNRETIDNKIGGK